MELAVFGLIGFAVFAVAVVWACCAASGDDSPEMSDARKKHEADMLREAMEEEMW